MAPRITLLRIMTTQYDQNYKINTLQKFKCPSCDEGKGVPKCKLRAKWFHKFCSSPGNKREDAKSKIYHLSNASSSNPKDVTHSTAGLHVYKVISRRTCILKSYGICQHFSIFLRHLSSATAEFLQCGAHYLHVKWPNFSIITAEQDSNRGVLWLELFFTSLFIVLYHKLLNVKSKVFQNP